MAANIFLKKKFRIKLTFLSLITIFFIIESLLIPINFAHLIEVPIGKNIPAVYQLLAKEKDDLVILELPILMKGKPEVSVLYMYFSTYQWKKLVNGSSSYYPQLYPQFVKTFINFPDEKSIRLIKVLDVKYIIIHHNLIEKSQGERIEKEIPKFSALILKKGFPNDKIDIYEVR